MIEDLAHAETEHRLILNILCICRAQRRPRLRQHAFVLFLIKDFNIWHMECKDYSLQSTVTLDFRIPYIFRRGDLFLVFTNSFKYFK